MTDLGVATRVHMREERALSKYRLARERFLWRQNLMGVDANRYLREALVAKARWSALREIIDAEERRAKVGPPDVLDELGAMDAARFAKARAAAAA